ncbi:MAG TPA: hypothetical protein ENN19_10755 [Chloroflexi bacterium]|nr:hypothetical protein [Chloroflexota bacterium]
MAITLAALLLLERWIHRHLQGVMLLLTGDSEIAVVLYALPLLPGILLHEMSHALTALLLGVRVGGISIRPKRAGQRVQLGFVPIEKTDAVRASLIGLAPLLTGSAVILLIGYQVFGVQQLETAFATGNLANAITSILNALKARDAWIWAYLIFAVGNTMLPSRSDRQPWRPVLIFLFALGLLIWIAGLGPTIIDSLQIPLTAALRWLTTVCTIIIAIDVVFFLIIALTEKLLERAKGMQVEY